jgi:regulatory protein
VSQRSHEDKLARAAAALAQAEGLVAGRGPGPASSAPGRDAATGRGRRSWTPPPEDPERAGTEPDAESVARAIVLRQLSLAPRSRAQLERKLNQRGCDPDVAARVLDRMTEVGLVDDEAYAELLVRSKRETKGLARKGLAHELRKQGIDQDVADEALDQVGTEDERARAELLVAKKLRTMAGLAPDVQARRLAGMLARKGYSGDVAWPVIREAVNGAPEHQRD